MLPDDDACRQVQKYRARELVLGLALGLCALTSTILYAVFLRDKIAAPLLIFVIVLEWLVLGGVYLIITSKMRRRK